MKHHHHHHGTPELEGVDPSSVAVFVAFKRAMHLNRQLMLKNMGEHGGQFGHAVCLRVLAANDGISQRDLADKLHLSRPTVTQMLQSLEKAGAIERRTDERDQRVTRVFLTDAGRETGRVMHAVFADHVSATIGQLAEEDRVELARLLAVLADHTEAALGSHAPTEKRETP